MLITFDHLRLLRDRSPLHLHAELYRGIKIERPSYQIASDALQTAICESIMSFSKKYGHIGGYNKKQKEDNERIVINSGRIPLHLDFYNDVVAIQTKFKSKTLDVFRKDRETYHYADFTFCDVQCRAHFGLYNNNINSLLFIKLAKHAGKYEKYISRNGDYAEAAFALKAIEYTTGRKPPACYIMATENSPPYAHAFFRLSDELLEQGNVENVETIERLKNYQKNGYPSYFDGAAKIVE